MIYRAALGLPWRPDEVLSEVLGNKPPPPTAEEEVAAGALQVMSDPPGATISVDGARVEAGHRDCRQPGVGMSHRVAVEMAGYEKTTREVILTGTGLRTLSVTLSLTGRPRRPSTSPLQARQPRPRSSR